MSLVNNDMGFFAGIDAQLGQYAAHLGERVVGGHDLDGGMACDIISDLIGLIALPIDTQQHVAMLMDLVLDQPHEGYCDEGVTWLLDGKGGGPTACDTLVKRAVGGNLSHSIFEIDSSLWSLKFTRNNHKYFNINIL